MDSILLFFALKYCGNWDKIYEALEKKEKVSVENINKINDDIQKGKYKFISILDKDYPDYFKNAYKPPFILFYEGNIEILKSNPILITGDNQDFSLLKDEIKKAIKNIGQKYSFVTGLYKGVDQFIYENKNENDKFIFIAANGLDNPYSSINKNDLDITKTLLLSEYPNKTHISKNSLRARNRLLAAAASKLVIASASDDSGVMNIVTNILNLGKDIYCMKPINTNVMKGNKMLLDQGAEEFNIDTIM